MINLTVVEYNKYHWRSLYFIGAGFSLAAAMVRACLPESTQYITAREEARTAGVSSAQASKRFLRECRIMLKTNCKGTPFLLITRSYFHRGSLHLGCLHDDASPLSLRHQERR